MSTIVSSMKDMQYDLSKSETVEDEFDIFGKHIAKQLRTLSTEQVILGQEEIQSVITKCRLHDLKYGNMTVLNILQTHMPVTIRQGQVTIIRQDQVRVVVLICH
ncbi:unnamed protein product [Pieris macdunnoughi]|uniref:Uncharacterized protein n=1 Tax=Pieris macdunnoughi TaxID=345717 RepID=A0A821X334_9NEOP|nr:unnamed protein product [Pieris macdunnoughi]